jgi:hypothetical protein
LHVKFKTPQRDQTDPLLFFSLSWHSARQHRLNRNGDDMKIILSALLCGVLARNLWAAEYVKPSLSCASFTRAYSPTDQRVFAYGYLEGVQAALTKGVADVLVPPSNADHPMWWVLPSQTEGYDALVQKWVTACKVNKVTDLLDAIFLTAARKKEDWPAFGVWLDKETGKLSSDHDKWKQFLGEDGVTCEQYTKSPEDTRQNIVTGYFIGTEAFRIATRDKNASLWMAWPLTMTPVAVRRVLDEDCAKPRDRDGLIRDALWVITMQLWVKQKQSEGNGPLPR